MATSSEIKEPWELMKQLRIADTGEVREVLEKLQELYPSSYRDFVQVVVKYKFHRNVSEIL